MRGAVVALRRVRYLGARRREAADMDDGHEQAQAGNARDRGCHPASRPGEPRQRQSAARKSLVRRQPRRRHHHRQKPWRKKKGGAMRRFARPRPRFRAGFYACRRIWTRNRGQIRCQMRSTTRGRGPPARGQARVVLRRFRFRMPPPPPPVRPPAPRLHRHRLSKLVLSRCREQRTKMSARVSLGGRHPRALPRQSLPHGHLWT
jgi:hypothetical protein